MITDKCPRCGCRLLAPEVYGEQVHNDPDAVCGHCGQEIEWVMQWVAIKKVEPNV